MSKVDRRVVEMLEKPVDVKKLVDRLFFAIDNLEEAAILQPKYYLESGRFKAQTALQLASYKRKYSRLLGKKSLRIRKKESGLKEGEVKAYLSVDPELQALQKKIDQADVYEDFAKQLVEAYKERLMVLAVLARLRASEINSELRQVKSEDDVRRLRKRAEKTQAAFAELEEEDA